MKLAILFSGGKDSTLALYKASKKHDISCLITLDSQNKDSYMFHTPAINLVKKQAKLLNIPLLEIKTEGEKETELKDLKTALTSAIKEHNIEGVVTGAVASTYQASRIQKICSDLDLWCFNPLWQKDQVQLLQCLLEKKFEVIITKIAADGLNRSFLGKKLTPKVIEEIKDMKEKIGLNAAFEGGEAETLVTNCPLFSKKIDIIKANKVMEDKHTGVYNIHKVELV